MEEVRQTCELESLETTDDSMPPLMTTYKHLLVHSSLLEEEAAADDGLMTTEDKEKADHQCELPVIDLADLLHQEGEEAAGEEQCRAAIVRAASVWGFFMVTNHGVPQALLDELLREAQVAVFRRTFEVKAREPLLDFSPESYRWGTPTATCLDQLSWSEAYHIPLTSTMNRSSLAADSSRTTRRVIEDVSTAMSQLAQRLARVLLLPLQGDDDTMTRRQGTCFLRLNRYPPCAAASTALVFGLCPHTDSDFLTILHQDDVGGLQILDAAGRWLAVRPRSGALIVNVGDLLQVWSNDLYRSVEHRVVASASRERFSAAFFLCPSYDAVIRPCCCSDDDEPRYASFTFREYRNRVTEDVRLTGRKLGLQPFRLE
jgi:gibberellin 2beta-dioxygenase